jgi:hypothetical protein
MIGVLSDPVLGKVYGCGGQDATRDCVNGQFVSRGPPGANPFAPVTSAPPS